MRMNAGLKTEILHIGGMTCIACQNRIEKKLRGIDGVESAKVSYSTGTANVTFNGERITLREISGAIEELDYRVTDGSRPGSEKAVRTIGILVIIFALYALMRQFGIGSLTSAFPLAEAGTMPLMLFVIGLVTSVHCVAMCGGINLSQCIPGAAGQAAVFPRKPSPGLPPAVLRPSILYNGGRVISYTVVGVIVGALGSVISFSGAMKGLVQLAAGVFMVIMGINMLGIFPWLRRLTPRLPRIFSGKIESEKSKSGNPLIVGLLNGLMPCGPLQAMQIYALSTGSPVWGGLSMLLFSLGTVPLMFGIGALSSVLSKKFTARIMTAGAVLVVVMGMTMFSNGWNLGGLPGFSLSGVFARTGGGRRNFSAVQAPSSGGSTGNPIVDGVQIVNTTLSSGRYQPITVQKGIPVKWTIEAPQGSINGCNNRMIIREYGIEHAFKYGENVIEFTPAKTGKFTYSCWMGMIRSSITVVEQGETPAAAENSGESGIPAPVPAGYTIPADRLALASIKDGIQQVAINLTDDGFDPAVVVMQEGLRTIWHINNDSLDEGNSSLLFPAYTTEFPMQNGENQIYLIPGNDFDFSTVDSVYYGYVKVVKDITAIDAEAIKKEAADFETLIWPPEYFEKGGAGCH
jgi:sulfite exporter TauE/SafE/copper chaperone CopZ/plastocyanin domain-containing protein